MKIAVGYIRCSSDEQTQDSVPRQQTEIERWAQGNNYTIREFFIDDGVSGTIPLGERSAGARLIDAIEQNKDIQYVIIWEYSRWGRDADSEQIYFWELYLNRMNVKLISLDNPDLTFKPAMERGIMRFVQRQTSSQENKSKSLRSYSGGRRNIELGYLNTNCAPFGYVRAARSITTGEVRVLRDGESIQKRFEKPFLSLSEPEAKIVSRIFELRTLHVSMRKIAQTLNEESIPSPRQKLWRKNVLNRIIANPVYYGAACWGKTTSSRIMAYENGVRVPSKVQRFLRRTGRDQWTINENAGLPPIVSKELWNKANSVVMTEYKPKGRSNISRYLVSGILFDQLSGSAMVGSDGCHYRRKDGSLYKKRYYINNNWHCQGIKRGIRSQDAEGLERKIISAIRDHVIDGRLVGKLEELIGSYMKASESETTVRRTIQGIEKQIEEKDMAIRNLLKAIQVAVDVESLVDALRIVEKEKLGLVAEKVTLQNSSKKRTKLPSLQEIGAMAASFALRFEEVFGHAAIEEQRQFVRQWVKKIELLQVGERRTARVLMRLIPQSPEFDSLQNQLVLSGPCRT